MLNLRKSFGVAHLLLLLLTLLHKEKDFTAMDGPILVISLELKEVSILSRFDDLLSTRLHLKLALYVGYSLFSHLILLVLLWIRRLDPVCVILLLIVGLNDALLNQVFPRLTQVHGDLGWETRALSIQLPDGNLIQLIMV